MWPTCWILLFLVIIGTKADEKYNQINQDDSFQFGYDTPHSYHYADGDRNNVVRGEFGARNPKTGGVDKTVYTAGPRGFRPRGNNIVRKYDLNQNGPRAIGSRDDPYFDPYEDPSYNFAFRTRTYSREENANRAGTVKGSYTYLDDVGERHNVEFVAGKNTGFHVKTPFPDSNPRAYGPLFFNGPGRPLPRGRTSIQRGLDGSYKFISAGPDQRRTETSDSTGHVRGSYTYLDDKGVQHSVHYIAGPETGYRVLKNVKGPHLPNVYPFSRPDIIPPDYYDTFDKSDVFIPAESGRPKPIDGDFDSSSSGSDKTDFSSGGDDGSFDRQPGTGNKRPGKRPPDEASDFEGDTGFGGSTSRPFGGSSTTPRPTTYRPFGGRKPSQKPFGGNRPYRPSLDDIDDEGDVDLFGGGGSSTARPSSRPNVDTSFDDGGYRRTGDDGSYKPESGVNVGFDEGSVSTGRPSTASTPLDGFSSGSEDVSSSPGGTTSSGYPARPGAVSSASGFPSGGGADEEEGDVNDDFGLFGSESSRPGGGGGYGPSSASSATPSPTPSVSFGSSTERPGDEDDFGALSPRPGGRRPVKPGRRKPGYRPGATFPGSSTPSYRPEAGSSTAGFDGGAPSGSEDAEPSLGISGDGVFSDGGTIVRNLGDKVFSVPPGASVRAHVQAIDLLSLNSRVPSPSEQYKAETSGQLNEVTPKVDTNK